MSLHCVSSVFHSVQRGRPPSNYWKTFDGRSSATFFIGSVCSVFLFSVTRRGLENRSRLRTNPTLSQYKRHSDTRFLPCNPRTREKISIIVLLPGHSSCFVVWFKPKVYQTYIHDRSKNILNESSVRRFYLRSLRERWLSFHNDSQDFWWESKFLNDLPECLKSFR